MFQTTNSCIFIMVILGNLTSSSSLHLAASNLTSMNPELRTSRMDESTKKLSKKFQLHQPWFYRKPDSQTHIFSLCDLVRVNQKKTDSL